MNTNLLQTSMPLSDGKKVETVTVKVNAEQQNALAEICKKEDRPMSYVMRELAMRGLALYRQDGQLKLSEIELESFKNKGNPVIDIGKKSIKKKTGSL